MATDSVTVVTCSVLLQVCLFHLRKKAAIAVYEGTSCPSCTSLVVHALVCTGSDEVLAGRRLDPLHFDIIFKSILRVRSWLHPLKGHCEQNALRD